MPLWHSRDLLHWEQLGYVFDARKPAAAGGLPTSGGIFCADDPLPRRPILYDHDECDRRRHIFLWTDDIRGEWSDPIWIDHQGIDPSLFWDADGRVYYHGTHTDENGNNCIGQFEIDLETGAKLSETKCIWYWQPAANAGGTTHVPYWRLVFLMIAEGGTEYGHMETIARSRSVWGPFESCPRNPILTHRNAHRVEFQALGHADLVGDAGG